MNNLGANSMSVVKCNGCGANNTVADGGTANCSYCDTAIASDKAASPSPPASMQQPQQYQPPQTVNVTVHTPAAAAVVQRRRSRGMALLLCIFLGYFGGHMFYVGRVGMGLLYLFTLGLFFIGVFIDFFRILFGAFRDSDGFVLREW